MIGETTEHDLNVQFGRKLGSTARFWCSVQNSKSTHHFCGMQVRERIKIRNFTKLFMYTNRLFLVVILQ